MPESLTKPDLARAPLIADYELRRPIGRGAYGEVWRARNLAGSFVALKIVQRAAFDHDRPFEREFEGIRHFEPISRSDPSQVAILHVGRVDGFFYYVMELADGVSEGNGVSVLGSGEFRQDPRPQTQDSILPTPSAKPELPDPLGYQPRTLKRLLNDRGALPAAECVTIALSLTRALANLHGHGLVHRDVKPSNVIFVKGVAKLADVGLVTSIGCHALVRGHGRLPAV